QGFAGAAEVGHPDFAGVEQAVDEALTRRVGNTYDTRTALGAGDYAGWNIGNLGQRACVEYLDAAGFVVAHGDQGAVLADCAAYAVAALHDATVDAPGKQVDFGQPAVAAEHVGVALVPRKYHRGVRQVAQALHAAQAGAARAFND